MFAFFRRMRSKASRLPATAPTAHHDFVVRHQIECGPFNTVRRRSGWH